MKKSNKSLAPSKAGENASNSTTQVVTGMNSLNLMVLTESLLFSEPQPLLETSAPRVTEVAISTDLIFCVHFFCFMKFCWKISSDILAYSSD